MAEARNAGSVSHVQEYIKQVAEPHGQDASILAQVGQNPLFTAGLGLAALGTTLAAAQKSVRQGAALLKRRLLVDVEINVKDESYPWFLHWMTVHQQARLQAPAGLSVGRRPQSRWSSVLDRMTPGLHHLSIQTNRQERPNGSIQTNFSLVPGPGRHLVRYRDAFILVNRVRDTKAIDLAQGRPWESVTLTTLYSSRAIFEHLFSEAHALAQQSSEGKTIVYTSRGTSWEPFGDARRKRPLDSVVLDRGVKEGIMSDVTDFLQSSAWYHDRGIPYRRGYLFYGPPGGGKSSFIQALAGSLDYNIAMLNLSERGLTDDRLNYLLTILPRRTLVLLEDVDAAFGNRRTQTDADGYRGANVTFSGLLNALDGVASAEERILFLTTNHVDRLDEALVRPGRVDLTVCFDNVTVQQAGELFSRFYGAVDPEGAFQRQFLSKLTSLGLVPASTETTMASQASSSKVSAAALQGLFLHHKHDMEGAIRSVRDLKAGL